MQRCHDKIVEDEQLARAISEAIVVQKWRCNGRREEVMFVFRRSWIGLVLRTPLSRRYVRWLAALLQIVRDVEVGRLILRSR